MLLSCGCEEKEQMWKGLTRLARVHCHTMVRHKLQMILQRTTKQFTVYAFCTGLLFSVLGALLYAPFRPEIKHGKIKVPLAS